MYCTVPMYKMVPSRTVRSEQERTPATAGPSANRRALPKLSEASEISGRFRQGAAITGNASVRATRFVRGLGRAMEVRDLEAAKDAFERRSVSDSVQAHSALGEAVEKHKGASRFMKSFVFGALDGIVSTFAVVSGASGGSFSTEVILALGLSSLVADAMSMGVGDALSSKGEMEAALREREREAWEFQNYPSGEIREMVAIYEEKGMSEEDARLVVRTLSKYEDVFVDLMVRDELGLEVPSEDDNPWLDGLVTFVSFVAFGFVPLLAYVALSPLSLGGDDLFVTACCLTAVTLFALGAIKSSLTSRHWLGSGFETFCIGGMVAAVSYLIGWAVESAT